MRKENAVVFDEDLIFSRSGYEDAGPVYMFANENTSGIYGAIGAPVGKSVLTVASSSDQAFESYAAGASVVDTFDLNSRQRYIMELKNVIIRNGSPLMFLNCFFNRSHGIDDSVLGAVKPNMSPKLREMLDKDWFRYSENAYPLNASYYGYIQNMSFLRDIDVWKKLSAKLPRQMNFIHSDISGLVGRLNRKYDVMLLSNILRGLYPQITDYRYAMREMYNQILLPLADNNLNSGGTICVDYCFNGLMPVEDYVSEACDYMNQHVKNPNDNFSIIPVKTGMFMGASSQMWDIAVIMRRSAGR